MIIRDHEREALCLHAHHRLIESGCVQGHQNRPAGPVIRQIQQRFQIFALVPVRIAHLNLDAVLAGDLLGAPRDPHRGLPGEISDDDLDNLRHLGFLFAHVKPFAWPPFQETLFNQKIRGAAHRDTRKFVIPSKLMFGGDTCAWRDLALLHSLPQLLRQPRIFRYTGMFTGIQCGYRIAQRGKQSQEGGKNVF